MIQFSDSDIDECDDSYLDDNYWIVHAAADDDKPQIKKKKAIHRPSKQLEPLDSYQLPEPPERLTNFPVSRPIYYTLNDAEYILTFYHEPRSIHIAQYSMCNKEWKHYTQLIMPSISTCPNFVEPAYNDKKKEIYFLYIDENKEKICAVLNLKSSQWKLIQKVYKVIGKNCSDVLYKTRSMVRSYFIPYPVGKEEIRTICHDIYCKYNVYDNKLCWKQIAIHDDESIYNANICTTLMWLEWRKTMLSFFGKHIFSCDVDLDDNQINEWNMCPVALPSTNDMIIVLGFEYILFIFIPEFQEIYLYDTLFGGELYESHQLIPEEIANNMTNECVVTKDNELHCINCNAKKHYKLSLVDLIPNDLYKLYVESLYHSLLCAYIARVYGKYKICIPNDISELILIFIPPFL